MVRVCANVRRHRLVALQTRCVRIHLRFQLGGARPFFQTGLAGGIEMQFVAGNAGEFSATKTGRRLHAIKLSSRHPNHAVAPKSTPKKIRLSPADEILLFGMIRRLWLNDETLREIVRPRTKGTGMTIEINLIRHVVECPDAVALAAIECRIGCLQARRISNCRIRLGGEMEFEAADWIAVVFDVLAPLAVAGFARDAELGNL